MAQREKSISVRFAAVGGQAVKAEMRDIGASGRQAMQGIAAGAQPATDGLERIGAAAAQARAQLEQIAQKAAASAAVMRTTSPAVSPIQQRVNVATGVTSATGMTTAEMLQQGQALDDLRAKFSPLYAAIRQYRGEVSEIRAAHIEGAISADEKAAALGRVRREALAAIDKIKGISAASREAARASEEAAAAAARQAQQMEALRARYNPVFGVIRQYKTEVASIRAAHASGAISAEEQAAAISRIRQSSLDSIAVLKGQTQRVDQLSRATRGSTLRMQQMFFQVNDIGVSLAGGMNPFVVMAQQGTQIAQIYGFGNGGVSGIFRDLAGLVRGIPPALMGVGVAAGIGALAIRGIQDEINEASGVVVTFGDTASAIFSVLGERILSSLGNALKRIEPLVSWLDKLFANVWDRVVRATIQTGNTIIKTAQLIRVAFAVGIETIPAMFKSAFTRALAEVMWAIGKMTWSLYDFLSAASEGLNSVFNTQFQAPVGIMAAGTAIHTAGTDYFDRSKELAAQGDFMGQFGDRAKQILGSNPMGDFFNDVSSRAQQNARDRLAADAGSGAGGGGGGGGAAAVEQKRAVEDLIKSLQQELLVLRETDPVKKKMLEYSEQLADATDSERSAVLSLVQQLDRAENGWEAVGRAMLEYAEDAKRHGDDIGSSITSAFDRAGDAFAKFVTQGKLEWRDLITSMAEEQARLAFQQNVAGPFASWFGRTLGNLGQTDALTASLASAGAPVSSFAGAGMMRSGMGPAGLDGRSGFRAMNQPSERSSNDNRVGMGGQSVRVLVGVDPKNGNLQAFVDERAGNITRAGLESYDRNVLPRSIQQNRLDPRGR